MIGLGIEDRGLEKAQRNASAQSAPTTMPITMPMPIGVYQRSAAEAESSPVTDTACEGTRAGPLPLTFVDYEELLRWTVKRLRQPEVEETGAVPKALAKTGLSETGFTETIRTYEKCFFTMVGSVHRIDLEAKRRKYKRRPGITSARRLYQASG